MTEHTGGTPEARIAFLNGQTRWGPTPVPTEWTHDLKRRRKEMTRCPTCSSPAPHLHPSVQYQGEVHVCHDDFHKTVTAENTSERLAALDVPAPIAGER